jgi:hypothetical protein
MRRETPVEMESTSVPYDGGYLEPDRERLCCNPPNLQICFDGILRRIWVNSDRKYNVAEIQLTCGTSILRKDSHPTWVLDYEDGHCYSTSLAGTEQYFGVAFRRIWVCPVAYALRSDSGESVHRLRSWVFQGRATDAGGWVTLDERRKDRALEKSGSFMIAQVETGEWFREFRVLQTGPGQGNRFAFMLAGFEIHGYVERIRV